MSNEQNNDRIMRKLRALLARADASQNDNEHEREIALRQATRIMDEHQISRLDLEPETRGKESSEVGTQRYRGTLYMGVAKVYGAKVYKSGKSIYVVGTPTQRSIVIAVATFLIESIEREARKLAGSGRGYIASFKKGASAGIWDTCTTMIRERRDECAATPTGSSLVVLYDQEARANEAWTRKHVGGLRKTSGSRASDYSGYSAGKAYGSSLNVNRPLSGGNQRLIG